MEFMFWGAFTWDKKGPCHIWQKETAAEKSAAKDWIDEENERLEPILRAEWGLVNPMRRLPVDKGIQARSLNGNGTPTTVNLGAIL
jgi:hypothetical protein